MLLGAGLLWSLNGALIKLTFDDNQGPSGVVIAFYRSLIAGLVLIPLARGKFHTLLSQRKAKPTGSEPSTIVGQGRGKGRGWHSLLTIRPAAVCCVIFFTIMTVCFIVANIKTEAASAIILQYTSTFWIFALSPWVLGEKPHFRDVWILAIAMTGIGIIFTGQLSTNLEGLLIALASGLFFGLLSMMIRLLRDADSAAIMVLNCLGSALLLAPWVALNHEFSISSRSLILLIIMGVVQFGLPYYLFSMGLKSVPAYQAGLLTLIEPVLVPVWTFLAVGEVPPTSTYQGGTLILGALWLYWLVTRKRRRT